MFERKVVGLKIMEFKPAGWKGKAFKEGRGEVDRHQSGGRWKEYV